MESKKMTASPTPKTPSTIGSTSTRSRFKFLSDTKAPNELNRLETQTHSRYTEFKTQLNQIDGRIAEWTNRFANEVMERQVESVGLRDVCVFDSLERCQERFLGKLEEEMGTIWKKDGNDDASSCSDESEEEDDEGNDAEDVSATAATETNTALTSAISEDPNLNSSLLSDRSKEKSISAPLPQFNKPKPTLDSLTKRVSLLSQNLTTYIHKEVPEAKETYFGLFYDEMMNTIPPNVQMEKTKGARRVNAIHHKFEGLAGISTRGFAEENALRVAELQLLEDKILEAGGWDELRTGRFLREVEAIRNLLEEEKKNRVANDKVVVENITRTREMLHRAVLGGIVEDD